MGPAEIQTFNQLYCAGTIIAVCSALADVCFSPYPFSLYLPYLDPARFLLHYLALILLSTYWDIPSWPLFLYVVLVLPCMKCQHHFMGMY